MHQPDLSAIENQWECSWSTAGTLNLQTPSTTMHRGMHHRSIASGSSMAQLYIHDSPVECCPLLEPQDLPGALEVRLQDTPAPLRLNLQDRYEVLAFKVVLPPILPHDPADGPLREDASSRIAHMPVPHPAFSACSVQLVCPAPGAVLEADCSQEFELLAAGVAKLAIIWDGKPLCPCQPCQQMSLLLLRACHDCLAALCMLVLHVCMLMMYIFAQPVLGLCRWGASAPAPQCPVLPQCLVSANPAFWAERLAREQSRRQAGRGSIRSVV
jgi:hypothetical protein